MLFFLFWDYVNKWSRAGRGALARNGEFWYPVRVIQYQTAEKSWLVRWWRGCSFEPKMTDIHPGSISAVPEPDIVDSLWGDRVGRRNIRVRIECIFISFER